MCTIYCSGVFECNKYFDVQINHCSGKNSMECYSIDRGQKHIE